jgi:hypothetical protein
VAPDPSVVIGLLELSVDGIIKVPVQEAVQPVSVPTVPLSEMLNVCPEEATTDSVVVVALASETGSMTAANVITSPSTAREAVHLEVRDRSFRA